MTPSLVRWFDPAHAAAEAAAVPRLCPECGDQMCISSAGEWFCPACREAHAP